MNYVDLGLSVKWSDRNVGAESPEEAGEHYCFDDIKDYQNLPTIEQWAELQRECDFKCDKEKNGVRVIGKNGSHSEAKKAKYLKNRSACADMLDLTYTIKPAL